MCRVYYVTSPNSVGTILKIETGTHFRGIYIPRKFHILFGKIYNLRTIVERKNSNKVVGYNRSKTPTRRIEWAKMFVSIGNITSLLTACLLYTSPTHETGRNLVCRLLLEKKKR